jgi:hypothetical protein
LLQDGCQAYLACLVETPLEEKKIEEIDTCSLRVF